MASVRLQVPDLDWLLFECLTANGASTIGRLQHFRSYSSKSTNKLTSFFIIFEAGANADCALGVEAIPAPL